MEKGKQRQDLEDAVAWATAVIEGRRRGKEEIKHLLALTIFAKDFLTMAEEADAQSL